MARERHMGILLLAAGLVLAAGAAGDLDHLSALPDMYETIANALRSHAETLRPIGYLLAGGCALIVGVYCLES